MTVSEYKLKQDFRAPKVNLGQGEMQSYRSYQKGSTVSGYMNSSAGAPLLIVENTYAIAPTAVSLVKDIEIDGKPVNPKPELTPEQAVKKEKPSMPKEYQAEMDRIKNTNIVGSIVAKSRNSVNGLLIGAGVGLLAAIIFKQSKLLGIVVGGTAGGFIGYKVTKDQPKNKAVPPQK